MGPVNAVSTPPMPPTCATIGPMNPDITPTASITPPIPVMSLPIISNTGPTAATIAAILTAVCFCDSSRLLNHVVTSLILVTNCSKYGATIVRTVLPSSIALFLIWFNAI